MEAKLSKPRVTGLIKALKIAVGSSLAIYLCSLLQLEFATFAGIVTLLTLLTTTLETVRLSVFRILTFCGSVVLAWVLYTNLSSTWLAYGLFALVMAAACEALGWPETISVNAVFGTHFLLTMDFSKEFIIQEFAIVAIGSTIAVILNLFAGKGGLHNKIRHNINYTEEKMQVILDELARYLVSEQMEQNVWDDTIQLEKYLQHFVKQSYEYQGNTMKKQDDYYVEYFEMRAKQCGVIHNLHYEMRRIRSMPIQAGLVSEYIKYLRDYVTEYNDPRPQIEKLEKMCRDLEQEDLPKTQEEFESRALLYHILIDLEEFLAFKKRFIEKLGDDNKAKKYWAK